MSFCPNKSSEQYKALVSQLGEANAYNAWFLKNKSAFISNQEPTIPTVEESKTLLADVKPAFNISDKSLTLNKSTKK